MLRFILPPATRPEAIRYASYVSGPYESFRTHVRLVDAKNSFRNRAWRYRQGFMDGKILELVEGEWYTLYDVKDVGKDDHLPWYYPYEQVRYVENPDYRPAEYDPAHPRWNRIVDTYYAPRPMTRDEYADWRLRVQQEIWNADF